MVAGGGRLTGLKDRERRVASDTAADARENNTFPKLLRHHARVRPARAAMRLKDRGVWRTWTWAQCADEIRALALALQQRGIGPRDKVAIVGANRPALYWAIAAAQWFAGDPRPCLCGRRR